MRLEDANEVRVLVEFPEQNGLPSYRDALFFSPAAWAALTANQLQLAKRRRYDAWVNNVRNPAPAEPSETPLETRVRLHQEKAELLRQQADVEMQLAEVEPDLPRE